MGNGHCPNLQGVLKDYGNKTQNQKTAALKANPNTPANLYHRMQTPVKHLLVTFFKYNREMGLNWSVQ